MIWLPDVILKHGSTISTSFSTEAYNLITIKHRNVFTYQRLIRYYTTRHSTHVRISNCNTLDKAYLLTVTFSRSSVYLVGRLPMARFTSKRLPMKLNMNRKTYILFETKVTWSFLCLCYCGDEQTCGSSDDKQMLWTYCNARSTYCKCITDRTTNPS